MTTHFVSASCRGEKCNICGAPATHKIGEEIFEDDPDPLRHNLTAYVCCKHFQMIMNFADRICPVETSGVAKKVFHHDDPPCYARLENGFCPECKLRPDMQSTCIYYYCPKCDLPLKESNECLNCGKSYKL